MNILDKNRKKIETFNNLAGVRYGQYVYIVNDTFRYKMCEACKTCTIEDRSKKISKVYVQRITLKLSRGLMDRVITIVSGGSSWRVSERNWQSYTIGVDAFLTKKEAIKAMGIKK